MVVTGCFLLPVPESGFRDCPGAAGDETRERNRLQSKGTSFMRSILGWLPNLFVLGCLGGIAFWGHETDWTFYKLAHHGGGHSAVHGEHHTPSPQPESMQDPSLLEFDSSTELVEAGINLATVEERPFDEYVSVPGNVGYVKRGIANLSARVPGTVWRVLRSLGDEVKEGELLAILDAVAVGESKAKFLEAMVDAELKEINYKRLLEAGEGVPERQRREAEAARRQSKVSLFNAQQSLINLGYAIDHRDLLPMSDEERARKLQFLGLPAELIATLEPTKTSANLIPVLAPFDGVITRCEIVRGEVVSPDQSQLTIANVDRMLVKLNISKEDAQRVSVGQTVDYQADGVPGVLSCRIDWISTEVDDKTRTVQAMAEVPNPGTVDDSPDQARHRMLKANTFGVGRIRVRNTPLALVVPRKAIQFDGEHHIVFIATRDEAAGDDERGWDIAKRIVKPGCSDDRMTEIIEGVKAGERVVVDGSHILKSELTTRQMAASASP